MLTDAGLPSEDFKPDHLAFVAEEEGEIVAAIGFEPFGDVGLLRSLVVAEGAKFKGVGRQLVAALEADARTRGVRELWLLTLDVDGYFQRLGFRPRDRADVPGGIRGSAEFRELCPEDAILMSKRLD